MRDIVHIQVGQCGNQISSKVFLHVFVAIVRGDQGDCYSIAGHAASPVQMLEPKPA